VNKIQVFLELRSVVMNGEVVLLLLFGGLLGRNGSPSPMGRNSVKRVKHWLRSRSTRVGCVIRRREVIVSGGHGGRGIKASKRGQVIEGYEGRIVGGEVAAAESALMMQMPIWWLLQGREIHFKWWVCCCIRHKCYRHRLPSIADIGIDSPIY
jgi:hypothetical protein